ncbi:helicase [Wad Medani virus]|uniref:Helicase n=1 Tax=Wad Medani virus TaxID=40067 RepID=A0A0H4M3R5_9REOV|nr:helicase [Wad Medani virus]AKP24081.1 helicase [Wad Medani virus]
MSVRLILLAPGDLIASITAELSRRHIDYKYDGINNESSDARSAAENREETRRNRELLREHTSGGGGDGRGDSGERSSGGSVGARSADKSGMGGRPDERDVSKDHSKHRDQSTGKETGNASSNDSRASGDQVAPRNVDDAVDMVTKVDQDASRGVFALTESIVGALRSRGSFHVQLLGDSEPRDGDVCYHVGAAVLKTLGLPSAEALAQKDAETHWRKQLGKRLSITKIHSPAMLEKLFPLATPERQHRTPVALVTNLKEYVPRAHIIFTAPTGDRTWKELAREATKRSNIRAYAHDPSTGPASDALLALIDAL